MIELRWKMLDCRKDFIPKSGLMVHPESSEYRVLQYRIFSKAVTKYDVHLIQEEWSEWKDIKLE